MTQWKNALACSGSVRDRPGMGKAESTVEDLVGQIERGELRLPEMQRRYVWKGPRVRDLLDSLYRGYPSGAILTWETDEDVPLQEFAVAQAANPYKTTRLLLDGQQRLTSLSAVIRGEPVSVRGRKRPIEILFNLEHPDSLTEVLEVDEEENGTDEDTELSEDEAELNEDELQKRFDGMTFVISTKKLEQQPHWVKVTDVFKTQEDSPFLQKAGVTGFDDPKYSKYSQRLGKLRGIRKYSYRLDILERSLSYDEVTEIFVRVNSLGAKLRSSDLALAQITAKWHGALAIFQEFQKNCAKRGYDFDLGIHLKNLVAMATGQSRFLTVGKLKQEVLESAWKECKQGMEFAMNFLSSNAGIKYSELLASPFLAITLAYYGHKHGDMSASEATKLRRWVLLANAKGRYSRGSTETYLDQDLAVIRAGGGADELLERLRLQVGRLTVVPGELEGRNQRSPLFKTMFLAFQAHGAKDWVTKINIDLRHSGHQHTLQYHHIFPKAFLKDTYETKEINDIANLSFIGGKTNRKIGAKPPVDYVSALLKDGNSDAFLSQCIPVANIQLFEKAAYREFLKARREGIAARLNEFLETEAIE